VPSSSTQVLPLLNFLTQRNLKKPSPELLSESDSEDDDDDDGVDPREMAFAIAQHRSPTQARKWAKQKFTSQTVRRSPDIPTSAQPRHSQKSRKLKGRRIESPLVHSGESESEDVDRRTKGTVKTTTIREEEPYDEFKRLSQPLRASNNSHSKVHKSSSQVRPPLVEHQPQPSYSGNHPIGFKQQATHKRSLLDEQPDARKISFDSPSRENTPQRRNIPSQKRKRKLSLPDDEHDNEFQDAHDIPTNEERIKRSRTTAAARRPEPCPLPQPTSKQTLHDMTERLIRSLHRPPRNEFAVRKGRGIEWTVEQENFLINQIEEYGPAWADIARRYCAPGEILEGRDQEKLKDKARNIKERYIR
jgi:hypothetical protein